MLKRIGKILSALAVVYAGVYVFLSVKGDYQPLEIHAYGVSRWAWAPLGFFDDKHPAKGSYIANHTGATTFGGWNSFLLSAFAPLYFLDTLFFIRNRPQNKSANHPSLN